MKINHKVLSIPPYISTSWKNIGALHQKGTSLVISLNNGSVIEVPSLPESILSEVYAAHQSHMEHDEPKEQEIFREPNFSFGMPVADFGGIEGMSSFMQHSMEKADSPDLPKEMLDKVRNLTKVMGMDAHLQNMPVAEPHCNCPYCQIARAVSNEQHSHDEIEDVKDSDLQFREWDIKEVGDKQFTVTNPLNQEETYHVFLGTPIGCTCGHDNCEHIKCVLSS